MPAASPSSLAVPTASPRDWASSSLLQSDSPRHAGQHPQPETLSSPLCGAGSTEDVLGHIMGPQSTS